jgi:hypothetical protein
MLALLLALLALQWRSVAGSPPPRTFMWDGAAMLAVRNASWPVSDPALRPVLERLAEDAAQAAVQGPWSGIHYCDHATSLILTCLTYLWWLAMSQ